MQSITCEWRAFLRTMSILVCAGMAAVAVINPNGVKAGTHLDELVVVKLGPIAAGAPLQADVVRLLKGELPPPPKLDPKTGLPENAAPPQLPKKIALAVANDVALATRLTEAMVGQDAALLFVGDFWGSNAWDQENPQVGLCGALRAGAAWFALKRLDANEMLVTVTADPIDMATIWPGLPTALDSGVKYASEKVLRDFALKWPGDTKVGALGGACHGALAVDIMRDGKTALMLLSSAGDKLYRFAADGTATDVTVDARITTKSRAATWADMNADGLLDLASWDGKKLAVYVGTAEGLAAAPAATLAVSACLGLTTISGPAGARVVMSTPSGPSVVKLAAGALVANALNGKAGLPLTAPCVVADVNNDGIDDIVQPWGGVLPAGKTPDEDEDFRTPPSLLCWRGLPGGWFGKYVESPLGKFLMNPNGATVADFDSDGLLDVLVSGTRGAAIARSTGNGAFRTTVWAIGSALGETTLIGAVPCDLNLDGRLDLALRYNGQLPQFAVHSALNAYNQSTDLALRTAADPAKPTEKPWEMVCAKDLEGTQEACAVADFTGDGAEDVVMVGKGGKVWMLKSDGALHLGVSLAAPATTYGPTRVVAFEGTRCLGARLAQPGIPAYLGKPNVSPVKLEWLAGGVAASKSVLVRKPTRVELTP